MSIEGYVPREFIRIYDEFEGNKEERLKYLNDPYTWVLNNKDKQIPLKKEKEESEDTDDSSDKNKENIETDNNKTKALLFSELSGFRARNTNDLFFPDKNEDFKKYKNEELSRVVL